MRRADLWFLRIVFVLAVVSLVSAPRYVSRLREIPHITSPLRPTVVFTWDVACHAGVFDPQCDEGERVWFVMRDASDTRDVFAGYVNFVSFDYSGAIMQNATAPSKGAK